MDRISNETDICCRVEDKGSVEVILYTAEFWISRKTLVISFTFLYFPWWSNTEISIMAAESKATR